MSFGSSASFGTSEPDYPLYDLPSAKFNIANYNARRSVCVIGSGAAGLITAHTLIKDGFTNVTVLSKDGASGGVWEHNKVYSGVFINNVYGDYRFSCLEMPRHPERGPDNQRLSAEDMHFYMEKFTETFLRDRISYNTEVLNIRRPTPPFSADPPNWIVTVRDNKTGNIVERGYDRVVLCTGGCHEPRIPRAFTADAARTAGFRGILVHSSVFRKSMDDIFEAIKPSEDGVPGSVVVIGGGKSAQDIAAYLANEGQHSDVSMVFEKTDAFVASSTQLPDSMRRSRLLGVLSPHLELRSGLERFLHNSWLGGKCVRGLFNIISRHSFKSFGIPKDSPLRLSQDIFWSLRVNDEVCRRGNSFHTLAREGKIKLIAPKRAVCFGKDGRSVVLSDGQIIKADAIILATGYTSSWSKIFDQQTMNQVGLGKYPPQFVVDNTYVNEWKYSSLKDPPPTNPLNDQWSSCIYRGIVPAKNIYKRDLAINGAVFSTNNGYVFETTANWISSYFLEDHFLQLPKSIKEATECTERTSAWLRKRYPDMLHWTNESHSSDIHFWSWPQYTDDLLRDMGLAYGKERTGGNKWTWLFKPIDIECIGTVGQERERKRKERITEVV
ncbi:FAD/NAD-P-binding domain-containing protein [Dendrothele bispora CBS 962.96]|uniref:FAD/NAD-P-binding domain-containing protein n=1 Tax=Dendrothele bispora (strain CBS 962.96) TaxID=1314807 RepID=A0A4S8LAA3_DENBC|nr:FAD/NAD-P-binding domain-containing protein [Dendrothele bispora CBS 962.96]